MNSRNKVVKNKDFVELKFTGYVGGKVFDSNISEDLKIISKDAKPEKNITIVGEGMVIKGLDLALYEKEIGKEYEVEIPYKLGFGKRNRELVKTIPLSVFTKQKINPQTGASFLLDNKLARIITVSGARVLTDFNNPLAGKDLKYKFTIVRFVTDINEKSNAFFKFFFKFIPEFEVSDKIIVKGQSFLESFVNSNSKKFKDLMGLDLEFELKEKTKEIKEKDLSKVSQSS